MVSTGRPTNLWKRTADGMLDFVYPKRCSGCGARGAWVCPLCFDDLSLYAEPWCDRCGIPENSGSCRCSDLPPGIGSCRSVGPYAGWLRSAIVAFKYDDEPARAEHLGDLLAPALASLSRDIVVSPVPLHPQRERERGYNQSFLVARHAARLLHLPLVPLLKRTRATRRQVGLDASDRHANVAGAFEADATMISARAIVHVVLVDDVMTTGSTLGACAATLRQAGVGRVDVVTIARDT